MAKFLYLAKIPGGKTIKGEVEAPNESEARVKIRANQMIPVKVVPKEQATRSKGFAGKIKSKELQIFTRQFATMINSGIPIAQSLEVLSNSTSSPILKQSLSLITSDLNTGKRLADSMATQPTIFNKLYVNLVKAGEEGGVLDTILNRLAEYIEKAEKIKGQIKSAMFYPASILVVSFIVIAVILTFVIPKFMELFNSVGQDLPAITQMVVDMSDFMRSQWYVVFGGIGIAIFGLKTWSETEAGKQTLDRILIQIPVLGDLIQKAEVARFSRTLATLLGSGVPILEALDICSKVVGNSVIAKSIADSIDVVSQGKSIVTPLAANKFIPDMVVQMIGVGEQTGALDTMLYKIADFYEDEVDAAVGALTSILEPLMMVVLGGIIAFLVIAMYMPIFDMAGAAI